MTIIAQLVDDVVVNKFQITNTQVTIGRHPDSDIQINDAAISSQHALITLEKSKYILGSVDIYVEDLDSKNGTFVNDTEIKNKQQLSDNDVIRFGWNEFKLIDADPASLEQTAIILK